MKTNKQLKKIYIKSCMETQTESEWLEEKKRTSYILGCHLKPIRSEKMQCFVDFIKENIYKGNTTIDRVNKQLHINFDGTIECAKKLKLDIPELQRLINKKHVETGRLIDSYFEKYRVELNNILNN